MALTETCPRSLSAHLGDGLPACQAGRPLLQEGNSPRRVEGEKRQSRGPFFVTHRRSYLLTLLIFSLSPGGHAPGLGIKVALMLTGCLYGKQTIHDG